MKFFYIVSVLFIFMQCTTVDFIPDPDFSPQNKNYSKNSWEDVEIYFTRPNKRFSIQGEIKIRDFENSGSIHHYTNYIKKDMFRKKMDGVWIRNTTVQSVQDSIYRTMDNRGNITHSHESEREVKVWVGYAYRDR